MQTNYRTAILKLKNGTFQIKNSEKAESRKDMAKEKSELQTNQMRIFRIKHKEKKSEPVTGKIRRHISQ